MPPIADTMRLVNSEKRNRTFAKKLDRLIDEQPFRGNIQQFELSIANLLGDNALLAYRLGAVDERRRHAARLERVDLVFHQGDEWRDHDGDAWDA